MEFVNEIDRFDQHFLIDKKIIDKFILEANLDNEDVIVEIGPGKGTISNLIAPKVKKLYLIELDKRLNEFLIPLCQKYNNIELIFNNVLDTYIPKCNKIVTSLPYSIVEPFINKIIKCDFEEILMITGSKYCNNVLEGKITKLALLTNCFFKIEKIMDILPESFNPKPRVLSSMLKLIPINEADLSDTLILFRNLYFYREKKVKNALIESLIRLNHFKNIIFTQREARNLIIKLEIPEEIMGKKFEDISNEELKILYKKCCTILV